MGEAMDDAAARVEAIRGQAHQVLDELLGRRKRRWVQAVVFAVGFKVGVLTTALAGWWFWWRGGREL
jgi:hypothetical protein